MKKLINLKKVVMEIAQILAKDESLCRLLINDGPDAMDVPVEKVINLNDLISDNYISIVPPVENRIEDWGRNTFISIILDSANLQAREGNTNGTIILYVSTNADHLLLNDNKNRLLEMADIIIEDLDATKVSAAGQLSVNYMTHVMLSEFHAAYRIQINISDQQMRKAEI